MHVIYPPPLSPSINDVFGISTASFNVGDEYEKDCGQMSITIVELEVISTYCLLKRC